MKASISELSACKRSLSVEVPPAVVDEEFDRVLRSFAARVSLDGFRKGKVPRQIVQQRYGKEIEQEVVEKLIREQSLAALKDRDLRPLATPVLKDYKYARESGLTFTAEFEVRPEITAVGYKEITVARREVQVGEIDVHTALDELRERRARFEGVEGRGLEAGDYVLADIQGTFEPGQGEPISQPEAFFEAGASGPHPELTEEIMGMKPGDERTFGVRFPKDHPAERLAGKRVVFGFTLKEIKSKRLPELNDDFAKEVGAETLDELRGKIREDLLSAARARERGEARKQALEQLLLANPDVDVPETLVDDRVEGTLEEIARSMAAQGMDPRQANVDWDEIRREQRDPARRSVISALLLDAIAKQESISATDEEVARALEHEAKHRRQSPTALRAAWESDGRLDALKRQLAREKSLDLVLGASNI
jgi:trigger factor